MSRIKHITKLSYLQKNFDDPIEIVETIPVRDWGLSPEFVLINWNPNEPIPLTRLVSIVFPDIEDLIEYNDVQTFKYIVVIDKVSWCSISSEFDLNNIDLPANGLVNAQLKFNNFNTLNDGNNSVKIKAICLGFKNNKEVVLEYRGINVTVNKTAETNGMQVIPNKSEYHVAYNQRLNKLFGDLNIRLNFKNISLTQFHSVAIVEASENKIFNIESTQVDLHKIKSLKFSDMPVGTYEIMCYASVRDVMSASSNVVCNSSLFPVVLKVISGDKPFYLSDDSFNFKFFKGSNEKATGSFFITMEQGADILVNSMGLEISTEEISSEKLLVKFVSKPACELNTGNNYFSITVSGYNYKEVIPVNIMVDKHVDYPIQDVIFCLDKAPMIINQSNEAATLIRSNFNMKFTDYNLSTTTIEQTYEEVFFNGKATLYPGEEVQDFFPRITDINNLINLGTNKLIASKLFHVAEVSIIIEEYDFLGNKYGSYELNDLKFLPGKKPLGFPFLTNSTIRSTYTESLISLSAVAMDMKDNSLGLIGSHLVDYTALENDYDIAVVNFKRSGANRSYGANNIITKATLSLEPKEDRGNIISAIFQNQNNCLDWFSFAEEYEENKELEQILSENATIGREFKALIKKKNYLLLNTGWIFKEEIAILDELIESKVCFIRLQEKWVKTIPIDKKPLDFKSDRSLNSMLVKFKIVDDER